MLDAAEAADPGIAHSIALTPENSLLLPVHATAARRGVEEIDGAYRGHIYRDCMVWDEPGPGYLIIVQPVVGRAIEDARRPSYFGDLRTGEFGTAPPPTAE